MQRIDASTAVDTLPADKHNADPGFFTEGDASQGIPGTAVTQDWLNGVQEELVKPIIESGQTLNKDDRSQLFKAMLLLTGAQKPLAAMDYPEIFNATNKIDVSAASATAGGTVSISAGEQIYLGLEIEAGLNGFSRAFTAPAYNSGDLDINSIYYIRCYINNGQVEYYRQKGTDTDNAPASLKGTPGAGSGGGFDSTPLDMLVAKVTTGGAGSTPTVIELANRRRFILSTVRDRAYTAGTGDWVELDNLFINWARKPTNVNASLAGFKNVGGGSWETTDVPDNSNTIYKCAVQVTGYDRYKVSGEFVWMDDPNPNGQMLIDWLVQTN